MLRFSIKSKEKTSKDNRESKCSDSRDKGFMISELTIAGRII